MTKIKLCGLSRPCEIIAANELHPEYIGFVFAAGSRRHVSAEKALTLKRQLDAGIQAVGVFVNENPQTVAALLNRGVIDLAQLHGGENEEYVKRLRMLTDKQIVKAFRIASAEDIARAEASAADYVLLDSGSGGTGKKFRWELIGNIKRPYFLAGGLTPGNVRSAAALLNPYAVDVSSGIETNGGKDIKKMADFVAAVRKEDAI